MDLPDLILRLADIPSHTGDPAGVRRVQEAVAGLIGPLADRTEWRDLPPRVEIDDRGEPNEVHAGAALVMSKVGTRRVLLSGHADTVYPDHTPAAPRRRPPDRPRRGRHEGRSCPAGRRAAAVRRITGLDRRHHPRRRDRLAVVPPPCWASSPPATTSPSSSSRPPPGEMTGPRGGCAFYDLVIRGRAAHVGRAFADGRSALHLACEAVGVLIGFQPGRRRDRQRRPDRRRRPEQRPSPTAPSSA